MAHRTNTNNWINLHGVNKNSGIGMQLKQHPGMINENSTNSLLSDRKPKNRRQFASINREAISVESLFPFQNDSSVQ